MSRLSIIKTKIKEALSEAGLHIARSKVIFIASCLAFITAAVSTYADSHHKFLQDLYLAFFMSAVFAMPATLLTQKLAALKKYLIQGIRGHFADIPTEQVVLSNQEDL